MKITWHIFRNAGNTLYYCLYDDNKVTAYRFFLYNNGYIYAPCDEFIYLQMKLNKLYPNRPYPDEEQTILNNLYNEDVKREHNDKNLAKYDVIQRYIRAKMSLKEDEQGLFYF